MENELAWWLNVGVQLFLCISGYLYGGKRIGDASPFCVKQFKKILLDYYIVVIPALLMYWIFSRENISVSLTAEEHARRIIDVVVADNPIGGKAA